MGDTVEQETVRVARLDSSGVVINVELWPADAVPDDVVLLSDEDADAQPGARRTVDGWMAPAPPVAGVDTMESLLAAQAALNARIQALFEAQTP